MMQRKLESSFASAQSDPSPLSPHEETLSIQNAQTDLNLRPAHMSDGMFSDVAP